MEDWNNTSDRELKRRWDWNAAIGYARRKGFMEGFETGFNEGIGKSPPGDREEIRRNTIKEFLVEKEYSVDEIADLTSTDKDFVMKIKG